MKNKHLQFVILFVIFVIAMDFVFGKVYESFYFSDKSVENDHLIHSVLRTNEDILIFGSSRANHHYNPKIFEDSLGMTTYNAGADGQNIYYHLALLEAALERYVPKIAILDLLSIDFEVTPQQWNTDKLGVFLPFAEQSEACMNAVLLRGGEEKIKMVSHIYPYNSRQTTMLTNNFLGGKEQFKGYRPLYRTWNSPIKEQDVVANKVDINKMEAIHRFAEICKQNNIQLFVFVSPHYVDFKGRSIYKDLLSDLNRKYGAFTMNLENDTAFIKHPEYFADPLHLNDNGAEKYSKQVVFTIKSKNAE